MSSGSQEQVQQPVSEPLTTEQINNLKQQIETLLNKRVLPTVELSKDSIEKGVQDFEIARYFSELRDQIAKIDLNSLGEPKKAELARSITQALEAERRANSQALEAERKAITQAIEQIYEKAPEDLKTGYLIDFQENFFANIKQEGQERPKCKDTWLAALGQWLNENRYDYNLSSKIDTWLTALKRSDLLGGRTAVGPQELSEAIKANLGSLPEKANGEIESTLTDSPIEQIADKLKDLGSASEIREWSKIIAKHQTLEKLGEQDGLAFDEEELPVRLEKGAIKSVTSRLSKELEEDMKWSELDKKLCQKGLHDDSIRSELMKRLRDISCEERDISCEERTKAISEIAKEKVGEISSAEGLILISDEVKEELKETIERPLYQQHIMAKLAGLGSPAEIKEWAKIILKDSGQIDLSTASTELYSAGETKPAGLQNDTLVAIAEQMQKEHTEDQNWKGLDRKLRDKGVTDDSIRSELVKRVRDFAATSTEDHGPNEKLKAIEKKLVGHSTLSELTKRELEECISRPQKLQSTMAKLAGLGSPAEVREWAKIILKGNKSGSDEFASKVIDKLSSLKNSIEEVHRALLTLSFDKSQTWSKDLNSLKEKCERLLAGNAVSQVPSNVKWEDAGIITYKGNCRIEDSTQLVLYSAKDKDNAVKELRSKVLQGLILANQNSCSSLSTFPNHVAVLQLNKQFVDLLGSIDRAIAKENRIERCRLFMIDAAAKPSKVMTQSELSTELKSLKDRSSNELQAFIAKSLIEQKERIAELLQDFDAQVDACDRNEPDDFAFIHPSTEKSNDNLTDTWEFIEDDAGNLKLQSFWKLTKEPSKLIGKLAEFSKKIEEHLFNTECSRIVGSFGNSNVTSNVSHLPVENAVRQLLDFGPVQDATLATLVASPGVPRSQNTVQNQRKIAGPVKKIPKSVDLAKMQWKDWHLYLGLLQTATAMPGKVLAIIFVIFAPFILFGISNPLKSLTKGSGSEITLDISTVLTTLLIVAVWCVFSIVFFRVFQAFRTAPVPAWLSRVQAWLSRVPAWLYSKVAAVLAIICGTIVMCLCSWCLASLFSDYPLDAHRPQPAYTVASYDQPFDISEPEISKKDKILINLLKILARQLYPTKPDGSSGGLPYPKELVESLKFCMLEKELLLVLKEHGDLLSDVVNLTGVKKDGSTENFFLKLIEGSVATQGGDWLVLFDENGSRTGGTEAFREAFFQRKKLNIPFDQADERSKFFEDFRLMDRVLQLIDSGELLRYIVVNEDIDQRGDEGLFSDRGDAEESLRVLRDQIFRRLNFDWLSRQAIVDADVHSLIVPKRSRDNNLSANSAIENFKMHRLASAQWYDLKTRLSDPDFQNSFIDKLSEFTETYPAELSSDGNPGVDTADVIKRQLSGLIRSWEEESDKDSFPKSIAENAIKGIIATKGQRRWSTMPKTFVELDRVEDSSWLVSLATCEQRQPIAKAMVEYLDAKHDDQESKELVSNAQEFGLTVDSAEKLLRAWTITDELLPGYKLKRQEYLREALPQLGRFYWLGFLVLVILFVVGIICCTPGEWPSVILACLAVIFLGIGTLGLHCWKLRDGRSLQFMEAIYPASLDVTKEPIPVSADFLFAEPESWWNNSTFHLFESFDPRPVDSLDRFWPNSSVYASGLLALALLTCLWFAIRSHNKMAEQKKSEANQFFKQKLITEYHKQIHERQRATEAEFKRSLSSWLEMNFRKIEFDIAKLWQPATVADQASKDARLQASASVKDKIDKLQTLSATVKQAKSKCTELRDAVVSGLPLIK